MTTVTLDNCSNRLALHNPIGSRERAIAVKFYLEREG